jgi:hypothetical protein
MHVEDSGESSGASQLLPPESTPAQPPADDSGYELVLVYQGVTDEEVSAVRWGRASFGLVVEGPLIMLCYQFGDSIPWSVAPCRWNQFPASERLTATWDDPHSGAQAHLRVSLVEAADGRVLTHRAAPLSRSLTRAWIAAIRRQAIRNCCDARYNAALSQFSRRFPRPDDLLAMAIATSVEGE